MLFYIAVLLVSWAMLHHVNAIEFQRHPFAISSQSFHREDVPLSYKFTATHEYTTTPKTDNENHEPHLQEKTNIQYAPLTALYAKYYGAKSPKVQTLEQNLRKDHLEPRFLQGLLGRKPTPEDHVHSNGLDMQAHGDFYVPGHNIQVKQSVTRIPAHNAIYKGYKDDSNKQSQYQRQPIPYPSNQLKLKLLEMAKTDAPKVVPFTPETTTPRIIVAVNRYANDMYETIPEKQQIFLYNLAPYTKKHALFLNVARAYNFLPNTMTVDAQPRAPRPRAAAALIHVKAPDTLANPQNTYSVLYSRKIKDKPCYGCGIEYNMYRH